MAHNSLTLPPQLRHQKETRGLHQSRQQMGPRLPQGSQPAFATRQERAHSVAERPSPAVPLLMTTRPPWEPRLRRERCDPRRNEGSPVVWMTESYSEKWASDPRNKSILNSFSVSGGNAKVKGGKQTHILITQKDTFHILLFALHSSPHASTTAILNNYIQLPASQTVPGFRLVRSPTEVLTFPVHPYLISRSLFSSIFFILIHNLWEHLRSSSPAYVTSLAQMNTHKNPQKNQTNRCWGGWGRRGYIGKINGDGKKRKRKRKKKRNFFLTGQEMIFVPFAEALLGPWEIWSPPRSHGYRESRKQKKRISSSCTKLFRAGEGH